MFTKNRKYLSWLVVLVINVLLVLLLTQYFQVKWLYLLTIVVLGVSGGLSMALFKAYANPTQLIYRYRSIIKGVGFGLLIGLGGYVSSYLDNQIWNKDLIKSMVVSIPVGVVIIGITYPISLRNLRRKASSVTSDYINICDSAQYETPAKYRSQGVLILTRNELVFSSHSDENEIVRYSLEGLQVSLFYSKSSKIPNGILINETDTLFVAYSKYWLQFITKLTTLKR